MSVNNKHISYTAEQLARYHSGEMTSAEMHELELAALNDPFLADALDGYAFDPEHSKTLAEIEEQLFGKKQQPAVVIPARPKYKWWLAAASVALIIGLGTWYLNLSTTNEATNVTVAETKAAQNTSTSDSSIESVNIQSTLPQTEIKPANPELVATAPLTKKSSPTFGEASVPKNTVAAVEEKQPMPAAAETHIYAEKAEDVVAVAPRAIAKETADNKAEINNTLKKSLGENLAQGKVVNTAGEPIAGAIVQVKGSNQSVATDNFGNFKIAVNDSTTPVYVSALGYNRGGNRLAPGTNNNLVLAPAQAELQEVVVSAMGAKRKAGASIVSVEFPGIASPIGGTTAFQRYVDEEINELVENKIINKGKVRLVFSTAIDGSIENILVKDSLCRDCDEIAKDLLLNGPKWSPGSLNGLVIIFTFR